MLIDINKKYKTRNGRFVLIKHIDDQGYYPVYGLICNENGMWVNAMWTKNGINYIGAMYTNSDLVEVEPEVPQQC